MISMRVRTRMIKITTRSSTTLRPYPISMIVIARGRSIKLNTLFRTRNLEVK